MRGHSVVVPVHWELITLRFGNFSEFFFFFKKKRPDENTLRKLIPVGTFYCIKLLWVVGESQTSGKKKNINVQTWLSIVELQRVFSVMTSQSRNR